MYGFLSMNDFKKSIEEEKVIEPSIFKNSELEKESYKLDRHDNIDKVVMVKKENIRRENIETNKLKQDRNDFETIKSQFLNHKNKPLYIQKNKHIIKNLDSNDQKTFIELAKSVLNLE
mgnify:CR=1 FL=1